MQIVVVRSCQKCRGSAAECRSGSLQNKCFTMFVQLGYRKHIVFSCLGRVSPIIGRDNADCQACRIIGPSWPKFAQNYSKGLPFHVIFLQNILSVMVRNSRLFCLSQFPA